MLHSRSAKLNDTYFYRVYGVYTTVEQTQADWRTSTSLPPYAQLSARNAWISRNPLHLPVFLIPADSLADFTKIQSSSYLSKWLISGVNCESSQALLVGKKFYNL